jgi:ubiquinone/menaquinone biosynthesis C-methylase UbiE
MANIVDDINIRTMRTASAVRAYSDSDTLNPAERASLERVALHAREKPILDLGVGGGRTVTALREVSNDYLGIDNSHEMLAACQKRYPGVKLKHADARNLSEVGNGSIFLAMFSCNGIGMVNHEDRLAIFREVHRVLQPGGVFLFSTHNQDCPDHTAGFRFPKFEISRHPVRLLMRLARFARDTIIRVYNRWRFRRHDLRTSAYSMINDVCHNYGTMLYYITLGNQRRQLVEIGFEDGAEAFDRHGDPIEHDSTHSSIAFIARKPV